MKTLDNSHLQRGSPLFKRRGTGAGHCKSDKEGNDRDKWRNKVEFFLACLGLSVGLGTVLR